MAFKSIVGATLLLVLSAPLHSAIITHGNLSTDDTTNYITDTSTGRQYLRFDAFSMTYADTVNAVSEGEIYDGWSIATSEVADDFYSAILGVGSTPCDGGVIYGTYCGYISGWADSDFGESNNELYDYFWFISTQVTPDISEQIIGLGELWGSNGAVRERDDWSTIANVDAHTNVNALLYKNVSAVPIPSAVWLFGSGLIGLIGVARRKA